MAWKHRFGIAALIGITTAAAVHARQVPLVTSSSGGVGVEISTMGEDDTKPATQESLPDREPAAPQLVFVDVVPGEDDLTQRWDGLSTETRVRNLREIYDDAITDIRTGNEPQRATAQADAALASLRAELYGTGGGRRLHAQLESELDRLRVRNGDE